MWSFTYLSLDSPNKLHGGLINPPPASPQAPCLQHFSTIFKDISTHFERLCTGVYLVLNQVHQTHLLLAEGKQVLELHQYPPQLHPLLVAQPPTVPPPDLPHHRRPVCYSLCGQEGRMVALLYTWASIQVRLSCQGSVSSHLYRPPVISVGWLAIHSRPRS